MQLRKELQSLAGLEPLSYHNAPSALLAVSSFECQFFSFPLLYADE